LTGPTTYKVSEAVGPLGFTPVVKQSIDAREVIIDFRRWLGDGESIAALSNFAILANPSMSYPSWQTDFPFVTPTTPAPADTIPLVLAGATVVSGETAILLIGNGTPGLAYMVSFLATVAPTQRLKEIDILVSINQPVNSSMISSTTVPAQSVTVVSNTISLTAGTTGSVNVSNTAVAPIGITLPPTPVLDQTINAKDVGLNAATFPVTWLGAGGSLIDGQSTFVFNQNGQAATFKWTGSGWSVL
jgi:hypothetical protein